MAVESDRNDRNGEWGGSMMGTGEAESGVAVSSERGGDTDGTMDGWTDGLGGQWRVHETDLWTCDEKSGNRNNLIDAKTRRRRENGG